MPAYIRIITTYFKAVIFNSRKTAVCIEREPPIENHHLIDTYRLSAYRGKCQRDRFRFWLREVGFFICLRPKGVQIVLVSVNGRSNGVTRIVFDGSGERTRLWRCDMLWVGQRCRVAGNTCCFDKDVGKRARSAGTLTGCVDIQQYRGLVGERMIIVICYGAILAASAAVIQRV